MNGVIVWDSSLFIWYSHEARFSIIQPITIAQITYRQCSLPCHSYLVIHCRGWWLGFSCLHMRPANHTAETMISLTSLFQLCFQIEYVLDFIISIKETNWTSSERFERNQSIKNQSFLTWLLLPTIRRVPTLYILPYHLLNHPRANLRTIVHTYLRKSKIE